MTKFTCQRCGYVGELQPESKALLEYEANFGPFAPVAKAIICNDCYEEFWQWSKLPRARNREKKMNDGLVMVVAIMAGFAFGLLWITFLPSIN